MNGNTPNKLSVHFTSASYVSKNYLYRATSGTHHQTQCKACRRLETGNRINNPAVISKSNEKGTFISIIVDSLKHKSCRSLTTRLDVFYVVCALNWIYPGSTECVSAGCMFYGFVATRSVEYLVFIRLDVRHCMFESVFSDFETDQSSGDVVDRWVNPAPNTGEAALVRSVLVGGPLQGQGHARPAFKD